MTRSQAAYGEGKTTSEVAKELEAKYGIVDMFYSMEEDTIVNLLEDVFGQELENVLLMQEHSKEVVTTKETNKIEEKFRRALSSRKFDGVISGVPTTAAQRGVSHLYKKPYARRAERPSFIDTGMYQRSFRAWIEED
jgi:hypothetical protein